MSKASWTCPIPIQDYPRVLLAHGGGGKLMNQLLEKLFLPAFQNDLLDSRHDGASFSIQGTRLAFTTDSYVVNPLFFPGGDIGSLAVYGTVNDLAMCGARPLYLSAGFILEEGLEMEKLCRIVESMKKAAERCSVQLATGDTKVVDRGKGDGLFINTAGIGIVEHNLPIGPQQVAAGDSILVSGDLGRHGIAIMTQREGLSFDTTVESDSAPLADLVSDLLQAGLSIHCMRDLTRGGLASALNEISSPAKLGMEIEEDRLEVLDPVRGACEILGLDPLYVANEGRFVLFLPSGESEKALKILKSHPLGKKACLAGSVVGDHPGLVTVQSRIGARRILDMMSGEQLPRIC